MVAIDEGGHEGEECELCPSCQFREALARFLDEGPGGQSGEMHVYAVSGLVDLMQTALAAFKQMEMTQIDEAANSVHEKSANDAAAAILRLVAAIKELRGWLLDDDPGDGL